MVNVGVGEDHRRDLGRVRRKATILVLGLRGYGPYAVEEKVSKKVLGPVGLWYPNDWPEPEIKWGLARHAWGMGYAREAAMAVKKMAFGTIENCNLISLILADNQSSIKVAKAVGAAFEKEIMFREKVCHIYRHA